MTLRSGAASFIAAGNIHAAGGGCELAMTYDLIVAGGSARFSCPEGALGVLTLQGGMLHFAEWLGRARGRRIAFPFPAGFFRAAACLGTPSIRWLTTMR